MEGSRVYQFNDNINETGQIGHRTGKTTIQDDGDAGLNATGTDNSVPDVARKESVSMVTDTLNRLRKRTWRTYVGAGLNAAGFAVASNPAIWWAGALMIFTGTILTALDEKELYEINRKKKDDSKNVQSKH